MILQGAEQFAALTVASVIAAEALVLTSRHPPFGLWLLMAFTIAGLGGWRFETVIAGFQVYPLDLVSVLLVTVSLLRLRNLETLPRPIILISVVLALAIARGVSELGTATAMNGARGFIYVFAAVVFARVCLIGRWSSIESAWFASAALLGVVTALFVARNGLGTFSGTGKRPLKYQCGPALDWSGMPSARSRERLIGGSGRPRGRHQPGLSLERDIGRCRCRCLGWDGGSALVAFQ